MMISEFKKKVQYLLLVGCSTLKLDHDIVFVPQIQS